LDIGNHFGKIHSIYSWIATEYSIGDVHI